MMYKTMWGGLGPWEGEAVSEADHFDYMSLAGDLVWLCDTQLSIAWRTPGMSRFSNYIGPLHFLAAQHLPRNSTSKAPTTRD